MGDAEEWAKSIEQKIRAAGGARRARDRAEVKRRDRIAEQAPALWERLCEEFRLHCDAFNKGRTIGTLMFHLAAPYVFFVRRDGFSPTLAGRYNPTTKGIRVEVDGGEFAQSLMPSEPMAAFVESALDDLLLTGQS